MGSFARKCQREKIWKAIKEERRERRLSRNDKTKPVGGLLPSQMMKLIWKTRND